MDPLLFLKTADKLASGAPTEADLRTAIGRLYYALFLTLRDGLARKDAGFREALKESADDHRRVRRYLLGTRFSQGRESRGGPRVGWYEAYDSLWRARETADYEVNESPRSITRLFQQRSLELDRLQQFVVAFASS